MQGVELGRLWHCSSHCEATAQAEAGETDPARARELDLKERLLSAVFTLGPDELAVLAEVADGMVKGRAVYGPLELATDQRDMPRETLEEVRDGLVYVGAALVRLRAIVTR